MLFNIGNQGNIEAARVAFHAAFLEFLGLADNLPLEMALLQVPSNTTIEEWEWLGDMPGFEAWDGDRILAALKAFKMRVENRPWSSGIRLHQDQFKDDKLGLFPSSIQGLAGAAKAHRVEFTEQLLLNGFDGDAFPDVSDGIAYDGKFFFDTTRATGSNRVAADPALSFDAVNKAEAMIGSQTTYDGKRKLRLQGTHLIVGPKNRATADQLLTADFLPNTAGTATQSNVMKGRYGLIVAPWFADDYSGVWMLADLSKPQKPCLFQMREEITTSAIVGQQGGSGDSIPRFQRGELWFGAEARYNVAYLESRMIVGSKAPAL